MKTKQYMLLPLFILSCATHNGCAMDQPAKKTSSAALYLQALMQEAARYLDALKQEEEKRLAELRESWSGHSKFRPIDRDYIPANQNHIPDQKIECYYSQMTAINLELNHKE